MPFDLKKIFKDVEGSVPRLGVVGYPLGHTFSPPMHEAAFRALKMEGAYRPLEVPPEEWEAFLVQARELPLLGYSATVPYKERVFEPGFERSPFVSFVGAANTVLIEGGRPQYHNTDGDGFLEDLRYNDIDVKGKNVLLLGAGGVARAVLGALVKEGAAPDSVTLANRHGERARTLIRYFDDELDLSLWSQASRGGKPTTFPLLFAEGEDEIRRVLQDSQVLINATSLGLEPVSEHLVNWEDLHKDLTVYDLIYHRETELMKAARAAGGRAVGGLGMLVHQGARAFEIWTGRKPPVDVMRETVLKELEKRRIRN